MPVNDMTEDLSGDIHRLRQRFRLLAIAVVIFASLLLVRAVLQRPDRLPGLRTIEANAFILRDANAQAWARLEVTASGSALVFFDEAGNRTARIPANPRLKPAMPR